MHEALNFDYATILTPVRYPDNYIGRLSVLFVIYYMRLSFTWRATFVWNRKPAQETWRLIPFFTPSVVLSGERSRGERSWGERSWGKVGRGGGRAGSFQDHFCLYFAARAFQRKRYRFLHTASVVSLNPQKIKIYEIPPAYNIRDIYPIRFTKSIDGTASLVMPLEKYKRNIVLQGNTEYC